MGLSKPRCATNCEVGRSGPLFALAESMKFATTSTGETTAHLRICCTSHSYVAENLRRRVKGE